MGRGLSAVLLFLVSSGPVAGQTSSIAGTVLAQGKPVEGVGVYCQVGSADKAKFFEAVTDKKGRFVISVPGARTGQLFTLLARAPDGRIGAHDFRGDDFDNPDRRIELLPGGEARGRLLDAQGNPLKGARIQVRHFSIKVGSEFPRSYILLDAIQKQLATVVDADGSFAIRGVPLGAGVFAEVSDPRLPKLNIGWNQDSPETFRLEKPGRVRLRFAGTDDVKKLAGLRLSLFVSDRAVTRESTRFVNFSTEATATGAGTLEFDNVLPGLGKLHFYGGQNVPYFPATLPDFTVKPGEVTELTVALTPAARVRGRVADRKTGKGIPAVLLFISCHDRDGKHLSGAPVKTGADGTFVAYVQPGQLSVMPTLPPPGYVRVRPIDREEKPIAVPARGEHTFPDIVLEPELPVEGVVVDDKGKPVPGLAVHSVNADFRSSNPTTDAKGRFVLKSLVAGDATALRARTQRAVTDGAVLVDTTALKGPVKLVLSDKWASGLKGRVVDGAGKPLAGAVVRLMWNYRRVGRLAAYSVGATLDTLRTDAAGKFQTTALWPGDQYHVEVTAEGYSKAQSAVVRGKAGVVHDAGTITLVGSNGFVHGVVVDSSGKPLAGVKVFNQGDGPRMQATTTAADGRFHLTGLYDGRCYVFARKPGYRFTMLPMDTGMGETRLTLLRSDEPPPALEQPRRSKEHVAAERKLARHVLNRGLALPEAATGGYRSFVFECLVRSDLPRANKWLAANPPAKGDKSYYVRVLRIAEAERVAGADVDEALALLAPLDSEHAFPALLKLSRRFAKADADRALRFAEEAVVQARTLDLPYRAWALAKAGELVSRLGRKAAGKKLLAEAVAFAEKFGSDGRQALYRAEVASYLAAEDLPRARALFKPLLENKSASRWLCRMAERLAATDVKAAMALLDEVKSGRSLMWAQTQLQIALRVAERDPAEAVRVADSIAEAWYQAEALVHVAGIVAGRDRKLAWSLIDRSFAIYLDRPEEFRSSSNLGGRGSLAAWTAGQAQRVGYPDMASVVARVLACRDAESDVHSPAQGLENLVRLAKVLALVDPGVAHELLERVASGRKLLASAYSGLRTEDWLLARCLADPTRAPDLIDDAIAKLDRKNISAFYDCGVIQLAQVLTAPADGRLRALMGLNSGLTFPEEE